MALKRDASFSFSCTTVVQAARDRGNCSSYRSKFITSPVRVPGFFIIPKIYHVIYAVTLSFCV